ncbi:MAG: hypothetical protein KC492_18395, partial [Myxococcales bacterium]|nr:hypothetical protein [Myxococcales bacterium]
AAVQRTVANTGYVSDKLYMRGEFPLSQLEACADRLSLDALAKGFGQEERRLIAELLFGLRDTSLLKTRMRCCTLTRILDSLRQYAEAGIPVLWTGIEDQLLYAPDYFGVLAGRERAPVETSRPAHLRVSAGYWREFCGHQYLTYALESLLWAVLEAVEGESRGMAIDDLVVRQILQADFRRCLEEHFDTASSPRSLLESLGLTGPPTTAQCETLRERIGYEHPASERLISSLQAPSPALAAARAIGLLVTLYAKWRVSAGDEAAADLSIKFGREMWIGNVLPQMDSWWQGSLDWPIALRFLINDLIVPQHDRVMYSKGRLDRSWLHHEHGLIVKLQESKVEFRSSRHVQSANMLWDLGLIKWDPDTDQITLTAEGERVRSRALERLA